MIYDDFLVNNYFLVNNSFLTGGVIFVASLRLYYVLYGTFLRPCIPVYNTAGQKCSFPSPFHLNAPILWKYDI